MEIGYILYFTLVLRVIVNLIGYKAVEWDSNEKFIAFIVPLLPVFAILMLSIGKIFPIQALIPLYAIAEILISQLSEKGSGLALSFAALSLVTLSMYLAF